MALFTIADIVLTIKINAINPIFGSLIIENQRCFNQLKPVKTQALLRGHIVKNPVGTALLILQKCTQTRNFFAINN
ncbi:hypothetical protein [Mucilaginibacter sp.]|uniref:hypothetical protein n=1 Tax=Mucilaginibacter sp. TaxID=1882438 RepID=UPI002ED2D96F